MVEGGAAAVGRVLISNITNYILEREIIKLERKREPKRSFEVD